MKTVCKGSFTWKTISLALIGALLLFFVGWRRKKKVSRDS